MQSFQQPSLQSSVSHDPLEIILICWFAAQETLLLSQISIIIQALDNFVETVIIFSRFFIFDFNNLALYYNCWPINLSLMNKSRNFFKEKLNLTDPKRLSSTFGPIFYIMLGFLMIWHGSINSGPYYISKKHVFVYICTHGTTKRLDSKLDNSNSSRWCQMV